MLSGHLMCLLGVFLCKKRLLLSCDQTVQTYEEYRRLNSCCCLPLFSSLTSFLLVFSLFLALGNVTVVL